MKELSTIYQTVFGHGSGENKESVYGRFYAGISSSDIYLLTDLFSTSLAVMES